jgi:hypothetical protein
MKRIILIMLVAIIGFSSCENYLDINKDPNNPTKVNPELVLPNVYQGIAYYYNVNLNTDFSDWMGYWAYADGWSGWYDLKGYNITHTNFADNFNIPYAYYLMDNYFIEKNTNVTTDANYKAISKVARALIYQPLVDAYGRVPYSEACSGNLYPKYDDGLTIYKDLLAQLDSASLLIKNNPDANNPGSQDIMFAGKMDKWLRFINTLKLKLLVRMSGVASEQANIKTQLKSLASADFITENVEVNPGYVISANKMQPFYGMWGFLVSDGETSERGQQVLNAFILQNFNNLNDPRLPANFDKSIKGGKYVGKPLGLEGDGETNPYNKDNGCLIGGAIVKLQTTATKGSLIFSAAEANFLLAEAKMLYPSDFTSTSSAKEYYEKGVQASFNYLGLTAKSATDYLAQDLALCNWDVAATPEAQLLLIRHQKYLSLCNVNGFEAWCEYRRTGVPDAQATKDWSMLSVYKGVSKRQIPTLLYLPQRELSLNTINANEAEKATGMNNTSTGHWTAKVFWDVN